MLLWYLLRRFTEQSSCQGREGSLAATKLLSSLHQVQEAAVNLVFKPQFLPGVQRRKKKPSLTHFKLLLQFVVYLHHQFLKSGFILLFWQFLQDAGRRLELGILFPALLWVPPVLPLGKAAGESLVSPASVAAPLPPPSLHTSVYLALANSHPHF